MSWRRIITGKTRKRPSRTSGSCWFARNGEFRASLRRRFTLTRFQSDITRLLRHVRAILSHRLSQSCREVNITPWLMCYVSFTLSSFVLIAKTTHLIPRNVVWTLWLGVNNNSNISASEDALVLFSFLHVLFPPSSSLMNEPVCLGTCEHLLCRWGGPIFPVINYRGVYYANTRLMLAIN